MPDTTNTRETKKLHIWQQNLNRLLEGQIDLLQSLKANDYDIVALQEPHIDFLGCTRANLHWTVIYPTNHLIEPRKTRSVILINHNLSMNNWDGLNIESNDVTSMRLHGLFGMIFVINIYKKQWEFRSGRRIHEKKRRQKEGYAWREKSTWREGENNLVRRL